MSLEFKIRVLDCQGQLLTAGLRWAVNGRPALTVAVAIAGSGSGGIRSGDVGAGATFLCCNVSSSFVLLCSLCLCCNGLMFNVAMLHTFHLNISFVSPECYNVASFLLNVAMFHHFSLMLQCFPPHSS